MADHAKRIMAMAAGAGYEVIVYPQPVADEASRSVMGLFAGDHALVAAGTLVQVEHQHALGFFQAHFRFVHNMIVKMKPLLLVFARISFNLALQLGANAGELLHYFQKVWAIDTDCLY